MNVRVPKCCTCKGSVTSVRFGTFNAPVLYTISIPSSTVPTFVAYVRSASVSSRVWDATASRSEGARVGGQPHRVCDHHHRRVG